MKRTITITQREECPLRAYRDNHNNSEEEFRCGWNGEDCGRPKRGEPGDTRPLPPGCPLHKSMLLVALEREP